MSSLQMNLEFLIQDCLKTYEYVPNLADELPSPIQTPQTEHTEQPFQFHEPIVCINFKANEGQLSPISPSEVIPISHSKTTDKPRKLFICFECDKSYKGIRQLTRHLQKHSAPDKYRCSIEGCEKTAYRFDAMRSHIKVHEKKVKRAKTKQESIDRAGFETMNESKY
jgi:uncharacterized Zn-finger protein